MGCVYIATNRLNGKRYVGKTVQSMSVRSEVHRACAKRGMKRVFYSAIRKYGFDAFDWELFFESDDESLLLRIEQQCISEFGTIHPNGYNMTSGGEGVVGACPDVGMKISAALKGRRKPIGCKRKPCSDERKERLRRLYAGRSYEDIYGDRAVEEREKRRASRSAALKKKWQDSEYRAKLVGKKRPCTEARRQALIAYNKRRRDSVD